MSISKGKYKNIDWVMFLFALNSSLAINRELTRSFSFRWETPSRSLFTPLRIIEPRKKKQKIIWNVWAEK